MRRLTIFLGIFCFSFYLAATVFSPKTVHAAQADTPEKVQNDLDTYAAQYLHTMNREIKPGAKSIEVVEHPEGYIARYLENDLESLTTSFSTPENKSVAYVGRVMFHRVEYVSIAKTKQQALDGPFVEANRSPRTELIMHMKGKWTYRY